MASDQLRTAAPTLRWAIDTAATPGRWGDLWGDTHFAVSLAHALRRLGQQVTIDRRDTRDRPSRAADDVVLGLRGLELGRPRPGQLNLLWVISHPDEVTAEEAGRYDRVFAASPRWARQRSDEWGIPVIPLLQCTDAELCRPERTGAGTAGGVLFLGNARRGAHRPIVEAAAAVTDVAIIGTGWENTEQADRVVATSVPNDQVGAYYAAADVVLNDHWSDMRDAGFVSNRLFDAVACGARVLSDPVDAMAELFDGSVITCESADDVRAALAGDPDQVWPDRARRLATAARVRAEHSFDQRAATLLEHALTLTASKPGRGTNPAERTGVPPARPLGRRWWWLGRRRR
ncbi:MAG: glycosyltransferase [Micropruina sp.]|uniref:glycosyltransferase family protein n=1 Tax=Micropruina sp. TaxID=2737536 RepID=UPI0039E2E4A9